MRKSKKLLAFAVIVIMIFFVGIQSNEINSSGLLSANVDMAMRWIDFGQDIEGQISQVTVLESTADHLTVGVSLPGMYVYPLEMADGNVYTAISAPGSGLFESGMPAVAVFGEWILIPNGTEVQLEINPGEPLI